MVDVLVPPSRPILRCDHGEEAHVNQSRYLTMVTRAFYCYRYTIVSIFFLNSIISILPLYCQCD
jgi:hypothetical protein